TTDIVVVLAHVLDDIPVADLRALEVEALARQETLEAEIRHDGRDNAVAAQRAVRRPAFGDDGHQLVAVDELAVLVDDLHTVGITIERDADIGAYFMYLALQGLGMGGAAFEIDVETIRLVADGHDIRPEFPESGGRHA